MVRRRGDRVRLLTRNGSDWSKRYPLIVAAALALPVESFHADGEAIWCAPDGLPSFDVLHGRCREEEVCLQAFDLVELGGEDLRPLALEERKARLARLLNCSPAGIGSVDHLDGDRAQIFAHACRVGCEGVVSKRRDRPYRPDKSASWVKTRNPASPAANRVEVGTFVGAPR